MLNVQTKQFIKTSILILIVIALLCLHSCIPEPLPL